MNICMAVMLDFMELYAPGLAALLLGWLLCGRRNLQALGGAVAAFGMFLISMAVWAFFRAGYAG